jgi:hypothetical protein
MSFFTRLLLMTLAVGVLSLELAQAQVVRRGTRGGIQVNAPFVNVDIAPLAGRPLLLRRRGAVVVPPATTAASVQAPAYYQYAEPTPVAEPTLPPLPSAARLAAADDVELFGALRYSLFRLDQRLARFDTGDTWQRYLLLSEETLGPAGGIPAVIELGEFAEYLNRFQSVAVNRKYAMIAELPSFQAAEAALAEVVKRFSGEAQLETEILPTPTPVARPTGNRGERSILTRK